jgi:hypothetical protein
MTRPLLLALALVSSLSAAASFAATEAGPAPEPAPIPNPAIDMAGFLDTSQDAAAYRESRRLSEADFLRLMAEPGTIVLDARSAQRYAQLHVRGAINLSFPDLAVESLASTIPDKNTRILIYCNNNFSGPMALEPFPTKLPSASLNLSTFVTLYDYGYRNVYELGPQIELTQSTLPFEGTLAEELTAAR